MIKNIIIAGVGGQGILTLAAIIDQAAMDMSLYIKQAEVHGMSQRGGAVQSHLRISDKEIYSDLIPVGMADLILSLEPMECLRYLPYLSDKGAVVTALKPVKNIPDYPDESLIINAIKNSGFQSRFVDAEDLARKAGNIKSANVVMIGAASEFVGLGTVNLEQSITKMFSKKSEEIISLNIKAFRLGLEMTGLKN